MINKIRPYLLSLVALMACADYCRAQEKPELIMDVEPVFQEKETKWKVERVNVHVNNYDPFTQEMTFRSGSFQAAISVSIWRREIDAHDVFQGTSIAFSQSGGAKKIKRRLPNLGDENYIWTNPHNTAWPTIYFRQGNVQVSVFAPSVAVAKRFARHIADQIPSN
jgi:hypothetical protein